MCYLQYNIYDVCFLCVSNEMSEIFVKKIYSIFIVEAIETASAWRKRRFGATIVPNTRTPIAPATIPSTSSQQQVNDPSFLCI